ncbi:hypothetical protein GPL20_30545 [Bradyrhizobium cajani]|uniref:Uncharacterized protein n=1 Tax=Bradyrhizobium cajani TaxID=1928661 RepID=A0A844TRY5_9BRAD|nr:hypothetical protein [Bradyrhizobium cajani]
MLRFAFFGRLHPRRHCEEPLRRTNPGCLRGKILDCFAALAMTLVVGFAEAHGFLAASLIPTSDISGTRRSTGRSA